MINVIGQVEKQSARLVIFQANLSPHFLPHVHVLNHAVHVPDFRFPDLSFHIHDDKKTTRPYVRPYEAMPP